MNETTRELQAGAGGREDELDVSGLDLRDPEVRNRVILAYYPLVRAVTHRLLKRVPAHVDAEEYVNTGVLGLIDAIERYDPSRGVPFRAYAEIRIRGAVVDALRAADWTPRSVRRKANRLQETREKLRLRLQREPSPAEMAEALGLDSEAYEALRHSAQGRRLLSMNAPVAPDSETSLEEQLASDDESFEERWMEQERRQAVATALDELPQRERLAITLSYFHGLKLREIGEILGVTESRVCQLRSRGLKRLKQRLASADV